MAEKMLTRSLTDVFVLMRNNAFYKHDIYEEGRSTDNDTLLLNGRAREPEEILQASPPWHDKFEEAQYVLSLIPPKMAELNDLHKRHLLRPMLSETETEETQIEEMSHEMTQLISKAHKNIDGLKWYLSSVSGNERKLLENIVKSLLRQLQEVTCDYRNGQNSYMKQLSNRDKTSSDFFDELTIKPTESADIPVKSFDNFLQPTPGPSNASILYENDDNVDEFFEIPIATRFSQKQLVLLEQDNTAVIETREKEVLNVMKSIVQLNEIYKELATMVQEQGTILDRIDYNVETTQVKVHQGYEQLKRAEFYQRKSRKLFCIMILASTTLVMLILLLITKL